MNLIIFSLIIWITIVVIVLLWYPKTIDERIAIIRNKNKGLPPPDHKDFMTITELWVRFRYRNGRPPPDHKEFMALQEAGFKAVRKSLDARKRKKNE